jgi:hypothetical protein
MDFKKFAPRVDSTKTEKTGERNTDYSLWHRQLSPQFFAIDIDFVEYREDRGIVAVLAVTGRCKDEKHIVNSKKYIWKRTKLERKILVEFSEKLTIPAYFVIHDDSLSIFHVHNLNKELTKFTKMNEKEYAEFIKAL